MTIKVVVADDQTSVREGLVLLFTAYHHPAETRINKTAAATAHLFGITNRFAPAGPFVTS